MKLLSVGTSPVGVIAIGANATGVIAIGALATGVVAIGQLARGGIVVGQLALGVVSIGQLSIGVWWSCGQLGIAARAGPGIVLGLADRLRARTPRSITIRVTILVALIALWWFAAGYSVVDALTRTGGVFVDAPRPLR